MNSGLINRLHTKGKQFVGDLKEKKILKVLNIIAQRSS